MSDLRSYRPVFLTARPIRCPPSPLGLRRYNWTDRDAANGNCSRNWSNAQSSWVSAKLAGELLSAPPSTRSEPRCRRCAPRSNIGKSEARKSPAKTAGLFDFSRTASASGGGRRGKLRDHAFQRLEGLLGEIG